ncbi:MAG: pectate lyase, partial [Candidatus Sumerlaeia bacterium]|nr:pectate lyase [Candidatus Sumerlaeia bacterium]
YKDERYLAAAKKGGDFLLLAQMPDPQPAWAQGYDVKMQPVWGRAFEPPAVSGAESQAVLESLLMLYRRTGDRKYIETVPKAIAYLRKSLRPDGTLARFYELQTNKPLYFTRKYELTYSDADMPTHYGFIWESRLDAIEAEYKKLAAADRATLAGLKEPPTPDLDKKAAVIVRTMDERGAWLEKGALRFHRIEPQSGLIRCWTFADNVKALCEFLKRN